MKKISVVILILMLSMSIKATNIPLDSIKKAVVSFLIENERYLAESNINDFCNCQIIERKSGKDIVQGAEGIFLFFPFSEHGNSHLLLIEKKSFHIINMINPIEQNLKILLDFMKRNHYSKREIYLYLSEFIKVVEYNKSN
jgi:hypothetical protein